MQPTKLLRIKDVLERYPVSKSSWYLGIQQGRYPKPIKLSERTSAWKSSDIDSLIDRVSSCMDVVK